MVNFHTAHWSGQPQRLGSLRPSWLVVCRNHLVTFMHIGPQPVPSPPRAPHLTLGIWLLWVRILSLLVTLTCAPVRHSTAGRSHTSVT